MTIAMLATSVLIAIADRLMVLIAVHKAGVGISEMCKRDSGIHARLLVI